MSPSGVSSGSVAVSPATRGYRWPAEWEHHLATWLCWPKNAETWPGRLDAVERSFVVMVERLLEGELVRITVDDAAAEERVRGLLRQAGVEPDRGVEFFQIPTDDAWVRDHGPLFLVNDESGECAVLDFDYDAWGGKYPPWDRDAAVPRSVAEALGLARFEAGLLLEPGSIDGDGRGTLLTTESCLLHPNRGHAGVARSREHLEQAFRRLLAVDRVLWLGKGIAGDDTDGHVDDLARFVAPGTVVTMLEPNAADENHAVLRDNRERLRAMRDAAGKPYAVLELPMPPPLVADGVRLPASYANFYIANRVVLMPTFGVATDELASVMLAECFRDREVVGIPSRDLVVGLGAVHCLTQQEPGPLRLAA